MPNKAIATDDNRIAGHREFRQFFWWMIYNTMYHISQTTIKTVLCVKILTGKHYGKNYSSLQCVSQCQVGTMANLAHHWWLLFACITYQSLLSPVDSHIQQHKEYHQQGCSFVMVDQYSDSLLVLLFPDSSLSWHDSLVHTQYISLLELQWRVTGVSVHTYKLSIDVAGSTLEPTSV